MIIYVDLAGMIGFRSAQYADVKTLRDVCEQFGEVRLLGMPEPVGLVSEQVLVTDRPDAADLWSRGGGTAIVANLQEDADVVVLQALVELRRRLIDVDDSLRTA